PFAGSEQLLASDLRRGVQVAPLPGKVGCDQVCRERVQVCLVARGNLQAGGLDLDKALGLEPAADGRLDFRPRRKQRPAVGVDIGGPPGAVCAHGGCLAHSFPPCPLAWGEGCPSEARLRRDVRGKISCCGLKLPLPPATPRSTRSMASP